MALYRIDRGGFLRRDERIIGWTPRDFLASILARKREPRWICRYCGKQPRNKPFLGNLHRCVSSHERHEIDMHNLVLEAIMRQAQQDNPPEVNKMHMEEFKKP